MKKGRKGETNGKTERRVLGWKNRRIKDGRKKRTMAGRKKRRKDGRKKELKKGRKEGRGLTYRWRKRRSAPSAGQG